MIHCLGWNEEPKDDDLMIQNLHEEFKGGRAKTSSEDDMQAVEINYHENIV